MGALFANYAETSRRNGKSWAMAQEVKKALAKGVECWTIDRDGSLVRIVGVVENRND